MVVELTVENIAIIERAQIALGPGLTVLTGETGAGKSLLVDAIELAFGARADSELVRTGTPRASVSVAVDVSHSPELRALCDAMGAAIDDSMLYLHREVFAEGRSQCRIAGKLAPVGTLRQLGLAIVDLHGQHDHQALLDVDTHLGLLDAWIGDPCSDLLAETAAAYEAAEAARKRLQAVRTGQREREQRLDLLRYQIGEIEAFGPRVGEGDELEAQLSRLQHAERLTQVGSEALHALADDEFSALERLRAQVKSLQDAERLDASLGPILETVRAAEISLEDGLRDLRRYVENVEANPELLQETADRLDALRRLRRKYGDDEAALLAYLHEAHLELQSLEGLDQDEATLLAAYNEAAASLKSTCAKLTALRQERAAEFEKEVAAQLDDLAMPGARFEARFAPKEPEANGADQVGFFFSANTGEPPKPLDKIASGGEISRVMLAIKTAMAGRAGVPTLIFDEVDSGLGGRAAAVVAQKLGELSAHYQVVAITHLPQIASAATTHFRIDKEEVGGRVVTRVHALNPQERVEEIARMIAGEEVGDSARAHAKEMIGDGNRDSGLKR
ncbi:MAG: DNA repair protein RecN [Fimbriimonadaceae bacterium]|nr:DNA repair protein RecN [Chthonomonadaceae bacterium]MCO5295599.1 DNA repair protein RecN [Fimbriimonadaceae bacterium]